MSKKKHPHQLVHNCAFVILLIFVCTFFFLSFLRAQPTNSVFLSSSSFSSDAHKQTHPHPHTNTPTHKQTHTDKPIERQIEARGSSSMLDWSSWVLTGAWSELVGLDRCLIGARGSWSVLDWSSWVLIVAWLELILIVACGTIEAHGSFASTELVGPDRCLTKAHGSSSLLDWSSSWSVLVERSELVGLLLERSLTEMGLAWSELGRSDREGELICVGIEMGREMGLAGDW